MSAQTTSSSNTFMPNLYAVILAGGVGSRFAPYSTPERPKQFLHVTDADRTMIQMTYDRITQLVPRQNVFISTNARYEGLVQEQLPEVPVANIVGEPQKRNTAAPIALCNHLIWMRDASAVNLFLPSDHFIADTEAALDAYKHAAMMAAHRSALITFGIVPTFPSPDYGYIHKGYRFSTQTPLGKIPGFTVAQFKEKPDEATAQEYIDTGEYFWNGGMFCWNGEALSKAVATHMPRLQTHLLTMERHADGQLKPTWLVRFFANISKKDATSIDYGIMEPAADANNVVTIPFDAGWSDVGGWVALAKLVNREGLSLPDIVLQHLDEQLPDWKTL